MIVKSDARRPASILRLRATGSSCGQTGDARLRSLPEDAHSSAPSGRVIFTPICGNRLRITAEFTWAADPCECEHQNLAGFVLATGLAVVCR